MLCYVSRAGLSAVVLSENSLRVDGAAHKDAVLYVGGAPRMRIGGVMSLPKSIILYNN